MKSISFSSSKDVSTDRANSLKEDQSQKPINRAKQRKTKLVTQEPTPILYTTPLERNQISKTQRMLDLPDL